MANKHKRTGTRLRGVRVDITPGMKLNDALKIFNKEVDNAGIIQDALRRREYEKPSVKRKRDRAKKLKNIRKSQTEKFAFELEILKRSVTQ